MQCGHIKEFDILALLAENPNRFYSADQLMELVWSTKESVDYRSLMVHMSKLRKKIREDPSNPTVHNYRERFWLQVQ